MTDPDFASTVPVHREAVEELARAFELAGWAVERMPAQASLSLRVGRTPVIVRNERAKTTGRICVEFEERGKPAGVRRYPREAIVIHLLPDSVVAARAWWLREQVDWRLGYRSSMVRSVGDNGGRAVIIPVGAFALYRGAVSVVAGGTAAAAVEAFKDVLDVPAKGGAR